MIVLTTRLPKEGFSSLKEHNIIIPDKPFFTTEELLQYAPQCDILVPTFDYQITADIINSMPNLRLIANFGVGYNNIDISAAKQRGIRVANTPQPTIEPTAEHTFSLMIAIAHRLAELDRKLRTTNDIRFGVMNNLGTAISNKTLGIIGMGRIGQSVARKARAFNMNIIYHNRHRLPQETEQNLHATYKSFDEIIQQSDFLSLNLPYTPDVHHMINSTVLQNMKPTAILINTARGAIVDEKALVDALKTKTIAAAALDVYEHEPHISPGLLESDNVLLSPHIGTGTIEGRIAMCENVSRNINSFLIGQYNEINLVI